MKTIKKFILFSCIICSGYSLFSQRLDKSVKLDFTSASFEDVLESMEEQTSFRFFYNSSDIDSVRQSVQIESESLDTLLKVIAKLFKHNYYVVRPDMVFFTGKDKIYTNIDVRYNDNMESLGVESGEVLNNSIGTSSIPSQKVFVIGKASNGKSQGKAQVNGRISSKGTGEVLIGATLFIPETGQGYATDSRGIYHMSLNPGEYSVEVSSVGYKKQKSIFKVYSSGTVNIELMEDLLQIDEVTIRASKNNVLTSTRTGYEEFSIKAINSIPSLLGEKDVIKSLLVVPGVKMVGEGTSGLYVRGGNMDQNSIYFNNLPIYNNSHLAGFVSSFNSNTISDFSIYKSSLPVEYGGRLSSVISIDSRVGDFQKFGLSAGISPIAATVAVNGPVIKDRISYFAGLRTSYTDYLLSSIESPMVQNSDAGFVDFTGSVDMILDKDNTLGFFAYYSKDDLKLADFNAYNYATKGLSVKFKHIFNTKNTGDVYISAMNYGLVTTNFEIPTSSYKQSFSLSHNEIKYTQTWLPNEKNTVKYGLGSILYLLDRGDIKPVGEYSIRDFLDKGTEKGLESSFFISDELQLTSWMQFYGGIRYSIFQNLGPSEVFQYNPNEPKAPENISDTLLFNHWENTVRYSGPELRLAINIRTGRYSSFKISYNQTRQYLFMLSNTIAVAPTDQWKLTDYNIKPLKGDQYSLGYYKTFSDINLITTTEVYYKKLKNIVEFKDGVNLVENTNVEQDIFQGDLDAYGVELSLKKYGRFFDVLASYNYSRSIIQINDDQIWNRINSGNPYPSNYDQPNMFNANILYKLSKRINIAGNIVYSTGRPITFPASIYYLNRIQYIEYSERNEFRLPDYFRMDFSVNIEGNLKSNKTAHSSWSLGVYNLTGRKNAYSLFFRVEDGLINGYKLAIIGAPILTATWHIKLGNYNSE